MFVDISKRFYLLSGEKLYKSCIYKCNKDIGYIWYIANTILFYMQYIMCIYCITLQRTVYWLNIFKRKCILKPVLLWLEIKDFILLLTFKLSFLMHNKFAMNFKKCLVKLLLCDSQDSHALLLESSSFMSGLLTVKGSATHEASNNLWSMTM